MTGLVLDTNAISAVATGTTSYTRALLEVAVGGGITLVVPSNGYAQAWANVQPAGRWFLAQFLDMAAVVVDPLDAAGARAVGVVLAGRRGPLDLGQAVVSARARGWPVLSGDPAALFMLAPDVAVEALP